MYSIDNYVIYILYPKKGKCRTRSASKQAYSELTVSSSEITLQVPSRSLCVFMFSLDILLTVTPRGMHSVTFAKSDAQLVKQSVNIFKQSVSIVKQSVSYVQFYLTSALLISFNFWSSHSVQL